MAKESGKSDIRHHERAVVQDDRMVLAISAAAVMGGVFAAALGACLGSFLGVVIDRVPKGQSITGRSHCICGQRLRAVDNVPIAGYLLRRGKARCCGAHIPVWYLGLEFAATAVAVLIYAVLLSL